LSGLEAIGGDLPGALDAVSVPSYAIDPAGVIRWINPAAEALVGDVRGRQFTSVVAPEDTRRAREHFARKVTGKEQVTDAEVMLVTPDGDRVKVEISSVTLKEGHTIVGVFGQVADVEMVSERPALPTLTPRQAEILHHLEHGRSTQQIARDLYLSNETVRNHVRHLLRALGVHTRLEAVALARHGLVSDQ
jgi:PAS domain S-box-containing protein